MKKQWSEFCVTLDKQKYTDAFMLKGDALNQGADPNDLTFKVNTTDLYVKQF